MPPDNHHRADSPGSDSGHSASAGATSGFGAGFSQYGERFRTDSGILELMQDLDLALNAPTASTAGAERKPGEYLMLGGGNPARIPEVQALLRDAMGELMADGDRFDRMLGNYDHPQGSTEFRTAVADLLRRHCGWQIDAEHIALTNGSQSAFYQLFNLLGGRNASGRLRRILLPLVPEYIGYGDTGIPADLFESLAPLVQIDDDGDDHRAFKYRLDFPALERRLASARTGGDLAALCVSRPTNPTGNVLSDAELARLSELAQGAGVPLIVDCAYGLPFPGIDFTESRPFWNQNTIVILSLSKFGMPGVRTGIVVARPEIVAGVRRMNAVMNLASGGVGPALALDMIRSGEILRVSQELIAPFYRKKSRLAVARFHEHFAELPECRVHRNEGAFFLWLWFAGLPIGTDELYRRLKERSVLVVPGQYYFPGWSAAAVDSRAQPAAAPGVSGRHSNECIRVSVAQDEATVSEGLRRIAQEVRAAWGRGP